MNSLGRKFRISIFGESHGEALGVVMDGVPAGIELSEQDLEADLARRRSGARGTTPRKESDTPHIVSGTFRGRTTGAPLTVLFYNENTRSADYGNIADMPRPSHADMVAAVKFRDFNDYRGGGHFSGRVTLGLVAAGAVAKKIIGKVRISSRIVSIGTQTDGTKFRQVIDEAMACGDSVGGVIECTASGCDAGWGEPFFDSVESVAAHLLFSIPAVKGVEFGSGFKGATLTGSQNNDPIVSPDGRTATNNAGGIDGGITSGNDIVVRIAVKPTASISRPQKTLNRTTGKVEELIIKGRHDACIALRAGVVAEAALAIALADFSLLAR